MVECRKQMGMWFAAYDGIMWRYRMIWAYTINRDSLCVDEDEDKIELNFAVDRRLRVAYDEPKGHESEIYDDGSAHTFIWRGAIGFYIWEKRDKFVLWNVGSMNSDIYGGLLMPRPWQ